MKDLTEIFNIKIILESVYLDPNFKDTINDIVVRDYENKVYLGSYINANSIKILEIGSGTRSGSHMQGHYTFDIKFKAKVDKITINTELYHCIVKKKNQGGIFALRYPCEIIVPPDIQERKNSKICMDDVKTDDIIDIMVLTRRIVSEIITVVGYITNIHQKIPKFICLPPDFLLSSKHIIPNVTIANKKDDVYFIKPIKSTKDESEKEESSSRMAAIDRPEDESSSRMAAIDRPEDELPKKMNKSGGKKKDGKKKKIKTDIEHIMDEIEIKVDSANVLLISMEDYHSSLEEIIKERSNNSANITTLKLEDNDYKDLINDKPPTMNNSRKGFKKYNSIFIENGSTTSEWQYTNKLYYVLLHAFQNQKKLGSLVVHFNSINLKITIDIITMITGFYSKVCLYFPDNYLTKGFYLAAISFKCGSIDNVKQVADYVDYETENKVKSYFEFIGKEESQYYAILESIINFMKKESLE